MKSSDQEFKLSKLLTFIQNHSRNVEVIKKAEELQLLLIQKEDRVMTERVSRELEQIDKLDLSGKSLDDLPEELSLFPKLTYLDLTHNEFKKVPAVIFKLDQLKVLILRGNQLESLPPQLLDMRSLNKLDILQNPLKEVPSAMSKFIRDLPYAAQWS